MSAQRLVSVVCYSQQVSRVNAAMRGPSKESCRKERSKDGKKEEQFADRKIES
jgi:hypothetical protein